AVTRERWRRRSTRPAFSFGSPVAMPENGRVCAETVGLHEHLPFLPAACDYAARADRRRCPAPRPRLCRGPLQPAAAVDHHADRPDRAAAEPQPAAPAAAREDAGGL